MGVLERGTEGAGDVLDTLTDLLLGTDEEAPRLLDGDDNNRELVGEGKRRLLDETGRLRLLEKREKVIPPKDEVMMVLLDTLMLDDVVDNGGLGRDMVSLTVSVDGTGTPGVRVGVGCVLMMTGGPFVQGTPGRLLEHDDDRPEGTLGPLLEGGIGIEVGGGGGCPSILDKLEGVRGGGGEPGADDGKGTPGTDGIVLVGIVDAVIGGGPVAGG
ncbi:hypothetical protein BS50DRAFT_636688 [Corynespora cassiicola Philippines]|uniref:Uncharacterized protein n=1 Tax=Corynespora cassiicola Philippines TaxID=1448308 RepID=A0A2T2NGY7_CORCC|nr:hypothetical protein BS50DRAFT_636688 [Corynespora cassiicola Philippines]